MTETNLPTKPGFYWAKWIKAGPGTEDNGEGCLGPDSAIWEPTEVWENNLDETDPEHLRVFVLGVSRGQALENFIWGERIIRP